MDHTCHQWIYVGAFQFIFGRGVVDILLPHEDAAQHFGDRQIADIHVLDVGQVDEVHAAGLKHVLIIDGMLWS
jgi:hypothetical protein